MKRGQPDDLVALGFKERNGGNEERIRTPDQLGKAGFKFAFRAGLENMDLPANCARRVLKISRWSALVTKLGSTNTATTVACGSSSCSTPSRFASRAALRKLTPVALPPGRLKLATIPSFTGSAPVAKTIGIMEVIFFAATAGGYSRRARPLDDGPVQPPKPPAPVLASRVTVLDCQVLPLDKTCLPQAPAKSSHKSGWLARCRACVDKADEERPVAHAPRTEIPPPLRRRSDR